MTQNWQDVSFQSKDGLKLHARSYGSEHKDKIPVLCLAGLTRNSKDFHKIATRLGKERQVIAPDYRGRGLSDYAPAWQTYEPDVEMADALALMDRLGLKKFVVIGTSRGGLIAMLMAQMHKDRLAGVVLNDIGPKIDDEGLVLIADSIRHRGEISDWDSLVAGLKAYHTGLKNLSDAQWLEFAHNCYAEKDGKIVPDYDYNLTQTFPSVELIKAGKIPEIWEVFSHLNGLPCGVIRGENSDLLSAETVEKMHQLLPGLISSTVPDRGHVPFLDEPEALFVIDKVLSQADAQ